MTTLAELLGLSRPYKSVMERQDDPSIAQYRKPVQQWDYASGRVEAPMFSPDDLIGSGIPTKLSSLVGGKVLPALAGIFIGPKSSSWNAKAAEEALKMKSSGVDPREIWKKTGTFTEHPKVPAMQEIPDNEAALMLSNLSRVGDKQVSVAEPMGNVLNHPGLYEAYPQLKSTHTSVMVNSPVKGGLFDPHPEPYIDASGPDAGFVKGVLLHELQHAVQNIEGWPTGGTMEAIAKNPALRGQLSSLQDQLARKGMAEDQAKKMAAYRMYRSLAGESQAEATRARSWMDQGSRRFEYPENQYTVPLTDLLVL